MCIISSKAYQKFITRLAVATLTFWFVTISTSLADWGTDVPINHPRFCEMQEIRVSRIADYLIGQILKVNMDTSTTGYIVSSHSWLWKKQILSMAGQTLNKMRPLWGIECFHNAQIAVNLFENIYQDVLLYDPNDPSTFPCKIGPKGSCR